MLDIWVIVGCAFQCQNGWLVVLPLTAKVGNSRNFGLWANITVNTTGFFENEFY
jgi:hypothetical protein